MLSCKLRESTRWSKLTQTSNVPIRRRDNSLEYIECYGLPRIIKQCTPLDAAMYSNICKELEVDSGEVQRPESIDILLSSRSNHLMSDEVLASSSDLKLYLGTLGKTNCKNTKMLTSEHVRSFKTKTIHSIENNQAPEDLVKHSSLDKTLNTTAFGLWLRGIWEGRTEDIRGLQEGEYRDLQSNDVKCQSGLERSQHNDQALQKCEPLVLAALAQTSSCSWFSSWWETDNKANISSYNTLSSSFRQKTLSNQIQI